MNESADIEIGDQVVDLFGNKGVVVKIQKESDSEHGTIFVWQSEKLEYGADNCEHYSISNWKELLRFI